ncbi:MAG: Nif3-like dinuclear metal center hexameric protein [Bacteroidales bacterium]|nr:Nif3-like dinuclear metal center hexameric protein [Bacteroidales bacterium]
MKPQSSILSVMFTALLSLSLAGQVPSGGTNTQASTIIESIIKKTGSPIIPNTVDVIKEGSPETPVTGIVTTMFATMEVLKKAVSMKSNLIIVHEPLYYNHLDDTKQFKNDQVFLEKQRYIREHKLVIWRFHDYIHSMKPDGVELGMIAKLGWKNYAVNGSLDQFRLPETTLKDLAQTLKQKFPRYTFYIVGNQEMKLTNVRLAPGAPGSSYHIELLEKDNVDVLLAGESPQWETYEYARDAVAQGRKKAVIFLGHIASEESGMDYCADWLKSFIKIFQSVLLRAVPHTGHSDHF